MTPFTNLHSLNCTPCRNSQRIICPLTLFVPRISFTPIDAPREMALAFDSVLRLSALELKKEWGVSRHGSDQRLNSPSNRLTDSVCDSKMVFLNRMTYINIGQHPQKRHHQIGEPHVKKGATNCHGHGIARGEWCH